MVRTQPSACSPSSAYCCCSWRSPTPRGNPNFSAVPRIGFHEALFVPRRVCALASPAATLCVLLFDGRLRLGGFLGYLLRGRQLRTIPSTAQGLHQCHRRGHLLYLKTIQSLLVGQNRGLCDQDVDVGIDAGVVTRLFELEKGLS